MTTFRSRTIALALGLLVAGAAANASGLPGQDDASAVRPQTSSGASHEQLKVLGLSLVLPGLAHLQMGERARGTVLLTAEVGFWAAYFGYKLQGSIRKDSYVEMAQLYAGVERAEGRTEEYYRRIGSWPSSDLYNDLIRRDARTVHGDDLEGRVAYFEANRVPDGQEWSWASRAAQDRYRKKRSDSRESYRRARNMLGLAAANRLVAMVDAVLLGNRKDEPGAVRLEYGPRRDLAFALGLRWSIP